MRQDRLFEIDLLLHSRFEVNSILEEMRESRRAEDKQIDAYVVECAVLLTVAYESYKFYFSLNIDIAFNFVIIRCVHRSHLYMRVYKNLKCVLSATRDTSLCEQRICFSRFSEMKLLYRAYTILLRSL